MNTLIHKSLVMFFIIMVTTIAISTSSALAQTAEDDGLPEGSFNINPLGVLQYGPILQYEAKISDRAVIVPYFRYAYLGLLTHLAWTGYDDNERLSPVSFGIGLGLKRFSSATGNTFYYGGFLDFSRTKANYSIGNTDETEEIATNLGVISNFGYRWKKANGTYINVGLLTGFGFTLKDEERFVNGGELYATYEGATFVSMVELSFGW